MMDNTMGGISDPVELVEEMNSTVRVPARAPRLLEYVTTKICEHARLSYYLIAVARKGYMMSTEEKKTRRSITEEKILDAQ